MHACAIRFNTKGRRQGERGKGRFCSSRQILKARTAAIFLLSYDTVPHNNQEETTARINPKREKNARRISQQSRWRVFGGVLGVAHYLSCVYQSDANFNISRLSSAKKRLKKKKKSSLCSGGALWLPRTLTTTVVSAEEYFVLQLTRPCCCVIHRW